MTIRVFVAADVSPSEKYKEFQQELFETGVKMKMVDGEKLHMTLKFLGDIREDRLYDIEKAMVRSVDGMQSIVFKLKGTGVFPSEESPRVIWVGIEGGESFIDIAESLEDELEEMGFVREERSFVPHLTVARVKAFQGTKEPFPQSVIDVVKRFSGEEFGEVRVDRIKLIKSQLTPSGPVYSTVIETKFF